MAANKAAMVQKQLHLRESCSNSTIGREGRWLIMHYANNQFYKLMSMMMMVMVMLMTLMVMIMNMVDHAYHQTSLQ